MAILKQHATFAGYEVSGKVSGNHDREREVYLAMSPDGDIVVLVVFNLECDLYHFGNAEREGLPDFIEEVKVCNQLKSNCFPKIIDGGFETVDKLSLGWIAREYFPGQSLADEIMFRHRFSVAETIKIGRQLCRAMKELTKTTLGGGHYNLRPENIIVNYDGDNLKGVHIVGLTNVGEQSYGISYRKHDCLSNLFRAPESMIGNFNQLSDVYSLGMLMLVMMLGDSVWRRDNCPTDTERSDDAETRDEKWMAPEEWNKLVWANEKNCLPAVTRQVLQKATAVNTCSRIPTVDKFYSYLVMLEKREVRATAFGKPNTVNKTEEMLQPDSSTSGKARQEEVICPETTSQPGKKVMGLDEVAGMSALKSVLRRNFVDIIKNRQMASMYGITPPNGILLYGAPGCGKTFVAEKVAQESKLNYKIVNPSDLGSIYIHGSQGKIAETFKEAEKNAPMILIFDEFDAIAPRRDADSNNQTNEVNEILTQLNNCASRGIFVMATTNRPDMIDSACLRAGRMDEKFYVGLPDADARKEIFAMELKKRPCNSDIDLDPLVKVTTDYTCGDISYIVKETARRCFDEALRNGDGNAVPLTTERLMEVAKNTVPSVSPKDIRLYQELKNKMEHRDKDNKSRVKVGFSTNS